MSLKDITPQNLLKDKTIQGLIYALDPELQEITAKTETPALFAGIEALSDDILALLAWQFHADFFDLCITHELKVNAVKNALKVHMKKGTVQGIKDALNIMDIEAEFIPWWEFGGDPYTFKLDAVIAGEAYRGAWQGHLVQNITRVINETKAARSYMSELNININEQENIPLYVKFADLAEFDILFPIVHPDHENSALYFGALSFTDGESLICSSVDDDPLTVPQYAGFAATVDGESCIMPGHPDTVTAPLGAGGIVMRDYIFTIGADVNE
mgnify:CR=1 FL=1